MKRLYEVKARNFGSCRIWAESQYKARAAVAREMLDHRFAHEFKEACNLIYSCRLVRS